MLGRASLIIGFLAATVASAAAPAPPKPYSPAARALIEKAFAGLDASRPVVDIHVHALGLGQDGDGTFVNPEKLSFDHPLKRLQTGLYLKASGVKGLERFDRDYVEVLVARAREFPRPLQVHLLAMDRAYHADGTPDPARTEFYVPNDHVFEVAARHPETFVPVVSIHPARADAITELERCAARGARMVKWLPNAQNIDPADPRHDAFYARMRQLGMVLLTHAGEEKAVAVKGAQELGNPLRLRRPLDAGVTVVVAHCASLGTSADLEHPGRVARSFDLFLRLMDDPRYVGQLYGDLSALTQVNRLSIPLQTMLTSPKYDGRLVNGSDYPLPGVGLVTWTSALVQLGLLTGQERAALEEIRGRNPLLFDFVLKRTLREPKSGRMFPAASFQGLPPPRA